MNLALRRSLLYQLHYEFVIASFKERIRGSLQILILICNLSLVPKVFFFYFHQISELLCFC